MKKYRNFIILSLFFLVIYSLVSIVRHYTFHSNAFDLGIFNQTLYDYAHLKLGPNTIRGVPLLLADHFEPIMFLFAPFYWLFGSYTLLIIQILFVLFGGLGIYLLIEKETNNKNYALVGSLLFYLSFGIFEALAFDYHNNVIGIMFVPWLFYFVKLRNFKLYYLCLILFLISKENLAIISIFLGLSLMIFEDKKVKKHGAITFVISLIYFILVLKVIIPYFNHGVYDHWSYLALGKNPIEAIKSIIFHPITSFGLLFNDIEKIKMWTLILVSGGFFAFLKPKYGILLIPIIAQKFFSSSKEYWGYLYQYSIEFAPIIPLVSVLYIHGIKKQLLPNLLITVLLVFNIGIVFRIHFYDGSNLSQIFSTKYFKLPDNIKALEEASQIIGKNSSLSTMNSLIPHFAGRDEINYFPSITESKYVLIDLNMDNIWPLKNKEELIAAKNQLEANSNYKKTYEKDGVFLYQLAK